MQEFQRKRRCAGCRKSTCNGCGLYEKINNPKNGQILFPDDFAKETGEGFGLVFDVGTTTMAAVLFDLESGAQLAAETAVNPGRFAGSDVISRIAYSCASDEQAEKLRLSMVKKLDELAYDCMKRAPGRGSADEKACEGEKVEDGHLIRKAVVAGNTAMCEMLLGLSLDGLCHAPFHQDYRGSVMRRGSDLSFSYLKDTEITVLPSIGGYVGADALSVYTWVKAVDGRKHVLAVDIGTNGEILLFGNEKDYACSTAAGPALEGAAVYQGMGAADGAICRIEPAGRFPRQDIACRIIGADDPEKEQKREAKGICGSGLVSALALFRNLQIIDEDGYLRSREEAAAAGTPPLVSRRIGSISYAAAKNTETEAATDDAQENPITGSKEERSILLTSPDAASPVCLTASDIRQLQLAKGAIRAGIETLLAREGICAGDIRRIYLAGSFGNSIRPEDAMAIGLLPDIDADKVVSVGNCAAMGAAMALFSDQAMTEMERDAKQICHVELADEPGFRERFLKEMSL